MKSHLALNLADARAAAAAVEKAGAACRSVSCAATTPATLPP